MKTTPKRLLTLTWDTKRPESPEEAYYVMSHAFSLLVKILRRRLIPKTLDFVMIVEATEQGYPHLHALLDCEYIPQRILSGIWKRLTGAPIVDIRQVYSPQKTASYLTKYLTKAPEVPHKCKHYRASRGYLPPYLPKHELPNGEPIIFQVLREAAPAAARRLLLSGYLLLDASHPWPWLELLEPTFNRQPLGQDGELW